MILFMLCVIKALYLQVVFLTPVSVKKKHITNDTRIFSIIKMADSSLTGAQSIMV